MRILIIDDSPADRELTIRVLEREFAGANFVEIGRRPEFDTALANWGFDAVLSDFRLHWTDGFRVLKEVRERDPYVPVIFMTESGSEEIAVEAMKAGLSDYVLKQHPQRLPIAVRESLEKSRLRQGYDQAARELQGAHAELRQAAEVLEQRVQERTAELAQANEILRQQGQDLRLEMAERRRVEEERERLLGENQRQRELLEHLIAAAPVGIAVVEGTEHRYEFANPAYLAVLGLHDADSLAGQPFALASPDLVRLATDLLEPARTFGKTISIREFERGSGEALERSYWDLDAVPLHDTWGQVAEMLVLVNDVSQKVLARTQAEKLAAELRRARDELDVRVRERTAELEAIFASMPNAIYVGNEDGIQRANQIALDDLGCDSIQALQDNIPTLNEKLQNRYAETGERIRPEDEAFARALRGQPWTYEVISRNLKTGQDVIQHCAARPISKDGQIIGAVAVNTDITQLKRTEQTLRQQKQRLQILHELDQAILTARSPDEIADVVVERVRQVVPCARASVLVYDLERSQVYRMAASTDTPTGVPAGLTYPLDELSIPEEHWHNEPHYIVDLLDDPLPNSVTERFVAEGLRSHLSLPLTVENNLIGCLNLAAREPAGFTIEDIEATVQVAAQLAVALQNARLHEQVRTGREQMKTFSRRLLEVQENQARAIARELHDELGQALTVLMLGLGSLERMPECSPAMAASIADLKKIADGISEELHRVSANLRPASLDKLGLAAALRQHVESLRQQTGLNVQLEVEGLDAQRLAPETEIALYRIVQEALTNVVRHAQASVVSVLLERRGDIVLVVTEDDGVGLDVEKAASSGRLGMVGMRERVEMLGGKLTVESSPGKGTSIFAELPYATPSASSSDSIAEDRARGTGELA